MGSLSQRMVLKDISLLDIAETSRLAAGSQPPMCPINLFFVFMCK